MIVIIISGLSGKGKTTIGRYLAKELVLPFFNKDSIKELLFDNIGWKDREWSQKLGVASYKILYWIGEEELKSQKSFIIESNFRAEVDRKVFLELKEKYNFKIIEILCKSDGKILFERFKIRAESGSRHPGHVDNLSYKEQKDRLIKGRTEPINLGETLEVDTTDWAKTNLHEIKEWVEQQSREMIN